jgi:bacteriocin-like protein
MRDQSDEVMRDQSDQVMRDQSVMRELSDEEMKQVSGGFSSGQVFRVVVKSFGLLIGSLA